MTTDLILGMIAGGGWGLFVGGALGAIWFKRVIGEYTEDDDKGAP